MFRIPNKELIDGEKAIVNLILQFRCVSFEQIHLYHVLKGLEKKENMERTLSKMRHLAVKYHFSCFEQERAFAVYRTDLDIPDVMVPMWIYLDFLQMGVAGSFYSTQIPHTPIVFEERKDKQLIEVVVVPKEDVEVEMMNQKLHLYDESLEEDEQRRRLFVVKDKGQLSQINVGHSYIGAYLNGTQVEYLAME